MLSEKKPLSKLSLRRILKYMLLYISALFVLLVLFIAARLFVLRHSITTYRAYWQQQAKIPVPKNGLTYVALGDSAAQAIGASRPQNGYVGLIAQQLQQSSGRPVHVINISVTGATVQDTIDRQLPLLGQVTLPADAVVTLDIGSNNVRGYDHAVFASQIDELFRQLPPQTVVADMPYFGGGRANKGEAAALDGSVTIKTVAQKYHLTLAPLHQVTKDHDGLGIYAADFFHPNNKGYRNWFQAFWDVMNHR
ncbi:MAG: hypothetical protein NVS1B7_8310 [Candidatus Saccharimonadales bacterium]